MDFKVDAQMRPWRRATRAVGRPDASGGPDDAAAPAVVSKRTGEYPLKRVAAGAPSAIGMGMPEEPTQALRFGKARAAQSNSLMEDYVELIADLLAAHGEARATEVAKRLGVTHPTAIKSVARLKREGLATSRPYRGIFLTEAGRELADRVRARHRLVVDLLVALGVPREAAEADAEGMEHHASDASLNAFARFLGRKKAYDREASG